MPRATQAEKLRSCIESGVALHAAFRGGQEDDHAMSKKVGDLGKVRSSEYSRANDFVGRKILGAVCRRDDPNEIGYIRCSIVFERKNGQCGYTFGSEPDDVLSKDNQRWIGAPIKR